MANHYPPTPIGKYALSAFALLVVAFLALETWSTWRTTKDSALLLDTLAKVPSTALADEKARQEMIALRLKNEQQRMFTASLVSNLSVVVGLLAAISGAWIAFHQHIRARTRERLDRAAIDFASMWEGLSSEEADKRAGSVAALTDFLSEDKAEFHTRVASALALVGRMKNKEVVNRTITPVIELVMRQRPASVKRVSWQNLRLFRANLSKTQLEGLDLRDSDLKEVDFCGSNLEGARFDAARLVGARFDGANLRHANLAYADLARASMRGTDLREADLRNIQLLDLDIDGADLRDAKFAPNATDWRLVKNWRNAILDSKLRDSLLEIYGPPVQGPKILMLMWEYPPIVSGGGWTAVHHFLTALRWRGAHLTVIVPLPASVLDRSIFGNEIDIIGVGREEDVKNLADSSAYDTPDQSEQAIERARRRFQYAPASTPLMNLVNEFQLRAVRAVDEMRMDCDVIHAHDWLTFPAAAAIAKTLSRPWVAHFHSTEEDRQPGEPSSQVLQIEGEACRKATRLVAVSKVTSARLVGAYQAPEEKIDVVPNCITGERASTSNLGAFGTSRVVYLGRLARQKGIDRFVKMANELRKRHSHAEFIVYGDGPERERAESDAQEPHCDVPPSEDFPPLSENEIKLGIRYVELVNIVAVSKDSGGNSKPAGVPVSDKKKEALEEQILRRGFTATPIDDPVYTHVIHVKNCGDEMHSDYAAGVKGLSRVQRWTTRFVSFGGRLPWARRFEAFDRTSVVIVPSRFEPFGLVVLEAMSHGVPVVYPKDAGVAEVIRSGVQFQTLEEAIEETSRLLADEKHWKKTAEAQRQEIAQYPERRYESLLESVWNRVVAGTARMAVAQHLASPLRTPPVT